MQHDMVSGACASAVNWTDSWVQDSNQGVKRKGFQQAWGERGMLARLAGGQEAKSRDQAFWVVCLRKAERVHLETRRDSSVPRRQTLQAPVQRNSSLSAVQLLSLRKGGALLFWWGPNDGTRL